MRIIFKENNLIDRVRLNSVRLLYMTIVYFPYLSLYRLAYIRSHLVRVILSYSIYNDSSLFFMVSELGSLIFFSLLSWSRHYNHHIAYFSGEHHRLLFISYLRKPKTEVTGHSEVDLTETITPVCSRSPEKLQCAVMCCLH